MGLLYSAADTFMKASSYIIRSLEREVRLLRKSNDAMSNALEDAALNKDTERLLGICHRAYLYQLGRLDDRQQRKLGRDLFRANEKFHAMQKQQP